MSTSYRRRFVPAVLAGSLAVASLLVAGCASGASPAPTTQPSAAGVSSGSTAQQDSPQPSTAPATEVNPPGDIPDNQVFLDYSPPGSRLHLSVPEGWSRAVHGDVVTFSDKLNAVAVQLRRSPSAPTVASAKTGELPALARSVARFAAGDASQVTRKGGQAVRITYQQDSAPDQVTGKVVRDAVERYEFFDRGQEAVVTLSGPVKADNVDPWRIISDSVRWR
jgi:hypothetical protein